MAAELLSPLQPSVLALGWTLHYAIGLVYGFAYVGLMVYGLDRPLKLVLTADAYRDGQRTDATHTLLLGRRQTEIEGSEPLSGSNGSHHHPPSVHSSLQDIILF